MQSRSSLKMRENPSYRPLHGALHDPPENDDAGETDGGVCRKLRARQFERRDRRTQRRHRVGMLVEFLRQRGNRRTIFEVPAVAELPIFFGSASQISERQVLLVSPSSILWRLVSCCGCCERFGLRRRRAICAAPAPGAAAAGSPRFWEVVPKRQRRDADERSCRALPIATCRPDGRRLLRRFLLPPRVFATDRCDRSSIA
jgi:hypothetical protein